MLTNFSLLVAIGSVVLVILTIGWIIFLSSYFSVHFLLKGQEKLRKNLERSLVELICSFFVASWTGVVKYHGPRPSIRPKQIKRNVEGADNNPLLIFPEGTCVNNQYSVMFKKNVRRRLVILLTLRSSVIS